MQVIKSIQAHQQKNIFHKKQNHKEKAYNLSVHIAEGYEGKTAKNLRESFKSIKMIYIKEGLPQSSLLDIMNVIYRYYSKRIE